MGEEDVLIHRARAGDRASLAALITRYWQPMFRLACRKTGNGEDAREIVKETFLKAFGALPGYREAEGAFLAYLSRIAVNTIIDYWRKKGRSPQVTATADYREPLFDQAALPAEPPLTEARREAVCRLVALLPADQRQAIELRIFAGLSVQESARLMGESATGLMLLQQRALKNLRRLFVEQGISV